MNVLSLNTPILNSYLFHLSYNCKGLSVDNIRRSTLLYMKGCLASYSSRNIKKIKEEKKHVGKKEDWQI